MDTKIAKLRNHSIICGFGRVGSCIAREFATARKPFVVIDDKEVAIQQCMQKNYLIVQGDAAGDDVLREAGVLHAQSLFVATDQDANNIYITLSARNLNPHLHIVTRANHEETVTKLKRAGADHVLSPYAIGGHRMANLVLQPTMIDFFDILMNAEHPALAVQEVVLSAQSPLIGKSIVDVQTMLTDGTMLLAIKRAGGLAMGSRQQTLIEQGDALILVSHPEHLSAFAHKYGR